MKKLTIALCFSILGFSQSQAASSTVTVDYGTLYIHDQIQTDSSTVTDYSPGAISGQDDPGPYFFYSFDDVNPSTASSQINLPNSGPSYAMPYNSNNSQSQFQSTGTYTTLGALVNDFPTGGYTVTATGTGAVGTSNSMTLASSPLPNTPTILNVNGSAAQWLGGKLVLNGNQTETINWKPFTNFSNTANGAHIDFSLYDTSTASSSTSSFDQQAVTGPPGNPGPGQSAISSYTFNPGDLIVGDTYNGTISYDLASYLETDSNSGGYDFAGNEVRLNFVVEVVPETNNFWLAGLALLALGLRFIFRQRKAVLASVA